VLGTSSGIHGWHAPYFIRRIRTGKNEAICKYLHKNYPELIEDEYFKPHLLSVISIPMKAPDSAIFKDEGPFNLLNRIKLFYEDWIVPGHRKGDNTHNVSATISVKEDEWDTVGEWMWDNRNFYNGLSVLNYNGHSYKQLPFEECDENTYEEMVSHLRALDLTEIVEEEDETNLKDQVACSGGLCEL
jgi:ribonucleoside-diphosphate reductase alpha chain